MFCLPQLLFRRFLLLVAAALVCMIFVACLVSFRRQHIVIGWSSSIKDSDDYYEAAGAIFAKLPMTTVSSPSALNKRARAVIVILTRNQDLDAIRDTVANFELVFNRKFHYPYVFLNDDYFSDEFKAAMTDLILGPYLSLDKLPPSRSVSFGLIPFEHWSYPQWINRTKAAAVRREMAAKQVMYGDSESYRHMCRYLSGFFYRHPLLEQYDYYWRLEPGAQYFCNLNYDPFVFMQENDKQYAFVLMMHEIWETVPTLWSTTRQFLQEIYAKVQTKQLKSPALRYLVRDENSTVRDLFVDKLLSSNNDSSDLLNITWTGCHFWSNFEIGSLNFLRSPQYQSYFDYLDKAGGFFYERWGDAPVHSVGAAIFLETWQIHHFSDIGYRHFPYRYTWCPADKHDDELQCSCEVDSEMNLGIRGHTLAECTQEYLENNAKFQGIR